ncbi:DUF4390 domain-containing protein [Desulfonema magnum]|uniref:DUF4390 n=1 Tax=Desulfonema magnum TaxID=45655 RepID=A0A975BTW6_9BACT|nr:DUF4390 domain-containing protein [Desulfonema magnum]QTA91666.1 DUF4390 [Desulfonema magnum]
MKRKICIILLSMAFFIQNQAIAQNARLSDITISNTHDHLELVYLNIKGTFTGKMRKAVLSGVPTTFLFFITLHKVRSVWTDKEIVNMEITHTIKYNSLKKEFIIKRSWENNNPIIAKSFKEAQKLMSEINNFKIIPLHKLEKGQHYQFKARAELSKLTLPLYLHYILFFVSLWDFETDWYTINFTY